MSAPVMIWGIVFPILFAYAISTQLQGIAEKTMEVNTSQAASPIPYETQALAGSWGGFLKNGDPIRLVVMDARPEWARVRLDWGKTAKGSEPHASMWTRAKILPDGRLCISYPLQLIFTLSEDSRSLVGTTLHVDPLASVLLTRIEEEQVRTAFR